MSRGQKQPYVRFFASDWLGGTRGMKANEVGVYITLIAMMYERCEPLPEDHRRLARQCGCTPASFKSVLELLIEDGKIIRHEMGLWNGRVQKEFDFREKNSQQAREAATARWEKDNKNNDAAMQPQCERNADGMPIHIPESRNQKESEYEFFGKVVRLNKADFERWQKTYFAIPDLRAELLSLDAFYAENLEPKQRKDWFYRASQVMNKKHQDYLGRHRPIEPIREIGGV